jgi:hypothetical protein
MHVGMGMCFAGRGNGNDRTWNDSREWEWTLRGGRMRKTVRREGNGNDSREWEWALRGGRMRKTIRREGNGNGRTRNDSLPLTALISSRDDAIDIALLKS